MTTAKEWEALANEVANWADIVVPSEVYTSKRALLVWLDEGRCEAANEVGLGKKVRFQSSDRRKRCILIRMKQGGKNGRGKWREVLPYEVGQGARPARRNRDRRSEGLGRDDGEAKTALGRLLGRSDD